MYANPDVSLNQGGCYEESFRFCHEFVYGLLCTNSINGQKKSNDTTFKLKEN